MPVLRALRAARRRLDAQQDQQDGRANPDADQGAAPAFIYRALARLVPLGPLVANGSATLTQPWPTLARLGPAAEAAGLVVHPGECAFTFGGLAGVHHFSGSWIEDFDHSKGKAAAAKKARPLPARRLAGAPFRMLVSDCRVVLVAVVMLLVQGVQGVAGFLSSPLLFLEAAGDGARGGKARGTTGGGASALASQHLGKHTSGPELLLETPRAGKMLSAMSTALRHAAPAAQARRAAGRSPEGTGGGDAHGGWVARAVTLARAHHHRLHASSATTTARADATARAGADGATTTTSTSTTTLTTSTTTTATTTTTVARGLGADAVGTEGQREERLQQAVAPEASDCHLLSVTQFRHPASGQPCCERESSEVGGTSSLLSSPPQRGGGAC